MIDTPVRAAWLGLVALAPLTAQDWPHWRGPNYDGATSVAGLPSEFDRETNVRWQTELPGPAASTPIVLGERIFLTAADGARERLVALCVARDSGEIVWERDADSGYRAGGRGSRIALGRRSNYASPSPTTDGERVVFFFGNGDLVSYDLDGEEQWRRNIQQDHGDFAFQWTFSASPTLWEGTLYLPVLQRDTPTTRGPADASGADEAAARTPFESFLLGFDPADGTLRFKQIRPSPAQVESRESYATPIPFVGEGGRKEILVVGGDVITGHDPNTGEELWRWGTWNEGHREQWWRLVPSPVVADGLALVCAPKQAPVFAVRLGGEGELTESALVWQSEGRRSPLTSDVPTPAVRDGHFYVLSDLRNALSKVRAEDGEVIWSTPLMRNYLWRASPTIADGRVWCIDHGGEVIGVDQETGEIVQRAKMGNEDDDLIRSSVVAAHGALFIRTNTTLFCVGG